jgi:hypothetical protein
VLSRGAEAIPLALRRRTPCGARFSVPRRTSVRRPGERSSSCRLQILGEYHE